MADMKLIMLRNSISLKFAMAMFSTCFGLSLLSADQVPVLMVMMCKLASLKTWGYVFLASGALHFATMGGPKYIPHKVLTIAPCLISLYLWVFLCISGWGSFPRDPLTPMFWLVVAIEVWLLAHVTLPHNSHRVVRSIDKDIEFKVRKNDRRHTHVDVATWH